MAKKTGNELRKIKPKIVRILKRYKIQRAGLFGSYARGENKKNSDVDLIIQPTKGMGLEYIGLALELEEKLGRKVDLVSYKYIHPMLKKEILQEEIRLL